MGFSPENPLGTPGQRMARTLRASAAPGNSVVGNQQRGPRNDDKNTKKKRGVDS